MKKRSELISKCKHQNIFTRLWHDTKDLELCFHCDISCCSPIGAHVLACAVYVSHIGFSKQKSSSSKRRFYWRILRGTFPVKTTQKWRQLFVWILLHCNFFVIRYIFWLKIAVYIYIRQSIYIYRNEIWNLSPMTHKIFSSESSGPLKFRILPKL